MECARGLVSSQPSMPITFSLRQCLAVFSRHKPGENIKSSPEIREAMIASYF